MRILATVLSAILLAAGVAACGGSGGSHASTATTKAKTTPSATGTATATSGSSAGGPNAAKLTAQAQGAIDKAAAAVGQLATGSSAAAKTARAQLAHVQAEANRLAGDADKLPVSNPTRTVVGQTLHQVALASAKLAHMSNSASTRDSLFKVQAELHSLSSAVGQAGRKLSATSATTIAEDLKSLALQLGIS